ncbi:hypothetical protein RJT34_03699 [Clitoria ternatea]|uniref:Uncharacterized protein n=1 Tax=Clitoria ternatea TaxID=43366 RepID=A0AAN9KJW6_CLITE
MLGYSQCSLKDISVSQQQTGAKVQGKPEWAVTITNKCSCVQTSLVLNCDGFKTSEPVDRSILSLMGPYCIVKAGDSITKDPITFKPKEDGAGRIKKVPLSTYHFREMEMEASYR